MEITNTNYTLLSLNGNLSNLSSQNQLCTGSYNPALAVFDILMVIINFPLTIYVIVELLLKKCAASSSSFSMSELFFLHICCIRIFFFIGLLLIIIRNFAGVTEVRQEYVTAFHHSSRIGVLFFSAAVAIDLFMAVALPVKYVGLKNSTKLKMAHVCSAFIWVYTITLSIVSVIFDISVYHPLPMTSFCILMPIVVFYLILVMISLRGDRPGKSSQSSKPDKTKENAVRFILNCMIIVTFYNLPYCCLLIYAAVKKTEWESLPCNALPLLLLVQTAEFVASLIFFYNSVKVKTMAIRCSTVFRNGIGLC